MMRPRTGFAIAIGCVLALVPWPSLAQTATNEIAPPRGLVASGVTDPSPILAPNPARGASLAPAAIPGDSAASLALRKDLSFRVREGRREASVPVPPALEIEVLDPNVDPRGNPAVIPSVDDQGRTVIDIPPVVMVHRYYYSGDRSFQGPMLPGGPSILVMNHPRTGDRLYIETQMLPGAPRVSYTKSTIVYNYGAQSIILKFGHHGKPSVEYRQGLSLSERLRQGSEARHERVDRWVQRTGFPEARGKIREGTSNALGATADGVRGVSKAAVSPVVQVIRATPIGSVFRSDPAKAAARERDALSRRAEDEARRFGGDIRTNR